MEETRQKNYLTQRTGSEIHLALTMTHHRLTEHDTKIKPTFIANCWNFITVSCWSQEELLADWAMNTGSVMVYSHVWSQCSGVVMGRPGTPPCSTEAAEHAHSAESWAPHKVTEKVILTRTRRDGRKARSNTSGFNNKIYLFNSMIIYMDR